MHLCTCDAGGRAVTDLQTRRGEHNFCVTPIDENSWKPLPRFRPANQIRSMSRAFISQVEDKAWYHDKQFWQNYLHELATSRINRFSLTFGIGYNFLRNVTGDHFHFAYSYLFDVPGYNVRVIPLSGSERGQNLETKDRAPLEAAISEYEEARAAWEAVSSRAAQVSRKDITFGSRPVEDGHWTDRLPAVDDDLAAIKALLSTASASSEPTQAAKAFAVAKGSAIRPNFRATSLPAPASFGAVSNGRLSILASTQS